MVTHHGCGAGAAASCGALGLATHGVGAIARYAISATRARHDRRQGRQQAMDQGRFEMLARQMAGGAGTRRAVMGLLAGGALAGLEASFGLTDVAAAKQKSKRKRRGERKRRNKQTAPSGCGADRQQCADGSCIATNECCPGQRQCRDGRCLAADRCCPEAAPPLCGDCEEPVCDRRRRRLPLDLSVRRRRMLQRALPHPVPRRAATQSPELPV